MKKNNHTPLVLLLMAALIVTSCQKNLSEYLSSSQIAGITKIQLWLSKQAIPSTEMAKFDELKASLDYRKFRIENFRNGETFFVVPINNSYKSFWDKSNEESKYLFMVVDVAGDIREGTIVHYRSKVDMPVNFFFNFHRNAIPGHDFRMTYLSLTDRLMERVGYSKNTVHTYTVPKKDPTSHRGNSQCTDWYMVTTTWYPDGSFDTEWQYLYTTCEGGQCPPEIMCLPGDGGGGSGGGEALPEESAVWTWTAARDIDNWRLLSSETLTGVRVPGNPYSGRFTKAVHTNEMLINLTTYHYVWNKLNAIATIHGNSNSRLATATCQGQVIYGNIYSRYVDAFSTAAFTDIFQ